MRFTVPILFVISMSVAGAMMGASGFNDSVGVSKQAGLQDDRAALEEETSEFRAHPGLNVFSLTGLVIGAVKAMVGMLTWSLMFPVALINVGIPAWFAIPLGTPIQIINYIGIWGIVRGMQIK